MSKYIKKQIEKKTYDNGIIRYEIFWTKQHSFMGIMLNKYSSIRDIIRFRNIEDAKEYLEFVKGPIKIKDHSHGEIERYLDTYVETDKIYPHFIEDANYNERKLYNAATDRFLFDFYKFKQHEYKHLKDLLACVNYNTSIEFVMNN